MKYSIQTSVAVLAALMMAGCNFDRETVDTLNANQPPAVNSPNSPVAGDVEQDSTNDGQSNDSDGSGSDSGQNEQQSDTSAAVTGRVARITYDYDNNGVMDGVDNISYDAQGRVTQMQFNYVGDSSADLLALRGPADTQSVRYDYNAEDRVSVSTISSGSTQIRETYAYGVDGELLRTVSTSPGITPQDPDATTPTDISYADGRPQRVALTTPTVEITLPNQPPLIAGGNVLSQTFIYGANGLPSTATSQTDGTQNDARTFTWRSDGQLDQLELIRSTGGSESVDFRYDAGNKLVARLFTTTDSISSFTRIPENGTEFLDYDEQNRLQRIRYDIGSNGSIEALITIEWEDGNCIPAFIFAMGALPNFVREENSTYVPGTGFLTQAVCDSGD